MLQKEMANRIISNKGSRNYGRISAMVQNLCKVSYMCDISRNVFHPKPKVDSSILMFQHKKKSIDVDKFSLFIKKCFKQRRKKLKNNLQEAYSRGLLGKYTDLRPEQISPEEYLILFNKIYF
jgi:16S rRNA (adenine1518-N6/adenine1519-N6)-dimethyltransferase